MISPKERIQAFAALGEYITDYNDNRFDKKFDRINEAIETSFHKNGWFDEREVLHAFDYWAKNLTTEKLNHWLKAYNLDGDTPKNVAIIAAGNIPLVGFHDVLCTLLSGHKVLLKCSSSDDVLLPLFCSLIQEVEPRFLDCIKIIPFKLEGFDAVIATGSNNSARHFEQYFGKYPSIIRKNRTGIAILDGSESKEELEGLIEDAYRYYGLGCRNITKLFLPEGFDLNKIFEASVPFAYLMENKKFGNNYTYHKTLLMMEGKAILENELLLLVENTSLYSPVSVLNYEYYSDIARLNERVEDELDHIQCVVSKKNTPFGKAQSPEIEQYADGIDTMKFLTQLT